MENIKIRKMEEWKGSFCEDFKVGDYVESAIAWRMIEAVPPIYFNSDIVQVGEVYSHIVKNGRLVATYTTFKKINDDCWQYLGNLPKIKEKETDATSEEEMKAKEYLRYYKENKINLTDLHSALYQIFGSYKKAVKWLYKKWNKEEKI